jgi:carbon storage regulator
MLVLTRRPGESIRIADDIEVTVLQASGNRVKLSFDAPKDVSICRSELLFSKPVPTDSKPPLRLFNAQPA